MSLSMRAWLGLTLLLVSLLAFGCLQSAPAPAAPGSDRDAHGCISSAGYTWCEALDKCLRTWEESCTAPAAPAPEPLPCLDVSGVGSHDACWLEQARQNANVSLCDRLYQSGVRDTCLSGFVSGDAALCAQMAAPASQDACYDRVARAINDSKLCQKLNDSALRRACISELVSPCAVEPDTDSVARCEAFRQRDPSLCLDDSCRFDYAQSTRTRDACDMMTGERATVLACRAVSMRDADYCAADNVSYRADLCYAISAKALNKSDWCSYGQQGSPYRDDCYLHFAIQDRNPDGCRQVYLETGRDICYLNYSVATDTPVVCERVINSLNRAKCYIHTALGNGDPGACNGLVGTDRTSCYNNVITGAVPVRDAQACMEITSTEIWQPRCLTAYAVQNKDLAACDLIQDDSYLRDCRAKLS